MGTRIESVATAKRRGFHLFDGALGLSDDAARRCLRRSLHEADELDLLINAGLYKARNMAEPALAAIIQEDIGANPGHPPRRGHHGTFSFDVLNGGCGVLTAMQLIDGFVGPGSAHLGMVVAADADPSPSTSHGFRFMPLGGAVLLAHDDGASHFLGFEFRTFPEDTRLFESRVRWEPESGLLRRGRNVVDVRESPAFGPRCAAHAIGVASEFLSRHGLASSEVDLLVASPHPRGFAAHVADGLAIQRCRLPELSADLASTHTAGPLAALEASMKQGRFARARHVLFVTAGAGITIGVALYRKERSLRAA